MIRGLSSFLAILFAVPVIGAEPFVLQNYVLLQPDFVLRERVGDVKDLAAYLKSIETAANVLLVQVPKPTPTSGFVVVAVRPGGDSRVWLDLSPDLPADIDGNLRSTLQRIAPFAARNGVVVVALNVTFWGAPRSDKKTPWPAEWKKSAESLNEPVETGDFVDRMWHAKVASECSDVYMADGPPSKYDPLAHRALDDRYRLVAVAPSSYESPTPVAGGMPPAPFDHDGNPVHGHAWLAYVITAGGRAESPTIVESTGPELSKAAIDATGGWRFNPGKVSGKAACTVALQEFNF